MKIKLKNKRRLHYIKIMSLLLVAFVTVAGAYAVITFNHTHELLYRDAAERFNELSYQVKWMSDTDKEFARRGECRNTFVVVDKNGKFYAEAGNSILVDFHDKDIGGDGQGAVLNYDSFRSSMTDSQYEQICGYLRSTPSHSDYDLSGDLRYELSCREYYIGYTEVYPKTVAVVVTNDENTWYVQDITVKEFELTPDTAENTGLYSSGETYRNIINKDFVLGEYNVRELLDYVEQQDVSAADLPAEFPVGNFSYIYYNRGSLSRIYSSFDTVENPVEADNYYMRFATKYNVLDSCFASIVIATAIIFLFFFVFSLAMARLSWRTIRSEIEQEQIRVDTTNAMAHDLKTPLFIISGYAENLCENINSDKREHYAKMIVEQTKRMDGLLHSMLDYSRLESYDLQLNRTNLDSERLIREILAGYPDNDIALEISGSGGMNADKYLITAVIHNFIDNAVNYGCGGISITLSSGRFEIENPIASDLTPGELEQIWKPYSKLDAARYSGGNGLGLSIASRILKLHGFRYGADCADKIIKFWFEF